jgi:hypothetical protein
MTRGGHSIPVFDIPPTNGYSARNILIHNTYLYQKKGCPRKRAKASSTGSATGVRRRHGNIVNIY